MVVDQSVHLLKVWKKWCPGEDSNFHDRNGHWHLKPARLPIPPPGLAKGQMPSFRHFPASAMKAQHNYNRLSVNPFIGAGHIGSFLGFIFLIRQRASQASGRIPGLEDGDLNAC